MIAWTTTVSCVRWAADAVEQPADLVHDAVAGQLLGRQVDRDRYRRRRRPAQRLRERLPHDMPAKLGYEPAVLGDGDEVASRETPQRRVVPPGECLDRGHPAGGGVDLQHHRLGQGGLN